jgi:hypothetical protein
MCGTPFEPVRQGTRGPLPRKCTNCQLKTARGRERSGTAHCQRCGGDRNAWTAPSIQSSSSALRLCRSCYAAHCRTMPSYGTSSRARAEERRARAAERQGTTKPKAPPQKRQRFKEHRSASYQRARAALLASSPGCWRCGATATTADHVPPLAEWYSQHQSPWQGELRPSCRPCQYVDGGWALVNRLKRGEGAKQSSIWR